MNDNLSHLQNEIFSDYGTTHLGTPQTLSILVSHDDDDNDLCDDPLQLPLSFDRSSLESLERSLTGTDLLNGTGPSFLAAHDVDSYLSGPALCSNTMIDPIIDIPAMIDQFKESQDSLRLEQLVHGERLNHLILNLHDENKGYSIAVKLNSGPMASTTPTSHNDIINNSSSNNPKMNAPSFPQMLSSAAPPSSGADDYYSDLTKSMSNHHFNGFGPNHHGQSTSNSCQNNNNNINNHNKSNALSAQERIVFETAMIPYTESSLLDFIDNEELPPLLSQLIDRSPLLSQYKMWHQGCLIIELRDHREDSDQSIESLDCQAQHLQHTTIESLEKALFDTKPLAGDLTITGDDFDVGADLFDTNPFLDDHDGVDQQQPPRIVSPTFNNPVFYHRLASTMPLSSYRSTFILLKPTNLSILNDVINLTQADMEGRMWSAEDRLQLESQIVLKNSPPLALEPDAVCYRVSSNSHSSFYGVEPLYRQQQNQRKSSKIFRKKLNQMSNSIQKRPVTVPRQLRLQHFLEHKRSIANGNRSFYAKKLLHNRSHIS